MQQTKQQKLVQIIKKLSPYRSSAEGLIVLLENMDLDEKILDSIVGIVNSSLKELKNSKYEKNIKNAIKELEKTKQKEAQEQDEADKILLDL